jgi:hypothetical protein
LLAEDYASSAAQVLLQHVTAVVEEQLLSDASFGEASCSGGSFATSPAAVQLTADALLLQYWWLQFAHQGNADGAQLLEHSLNDPRVAEDHLKHLHHLLDAQLAAAAEWACAAGVAQQQQQQQWPGKTLLLVTLLEAQRTAAAAAAGSAPAAAAAADDGDYEDPPTKACRLLQWLSCVLDIAGAAKMPTTV